ncbi:MAG: hypothetical protein OEL89_03495, partial [Candidatus Peregrinibacteria bacterium]|nr:hypothetical protein [Candidatus Peregrinibacteria bacterium]
NTPTSKNSQPNYYPAPARTGELVTDAEEPAPEDIQEVYNQARTQVTSLDVKKVKIMKPDSDLNRIGSLLMDSPEVQNLLKTLLLKEGKEFTQEKIDNSIGVTKGILNELGTLINLVCAGVELGANQLAGSFVRNVLYMKYQGFTPTEIFENFSKRQDVIDELTKSINKSQEEGRMVYEIGSLALLGYGVAKTGIKGSVKLSKYLKSKEFVAVINTKIDDLARILTKENPNFAFEMANVGGSRGSSSFVSKTGAGGVGKIAKTTQQIIKEATDWANQKIANVLAKNQDDIAKYLKNAAKTKKIFDDKAQALAAKVPGVKYKDANLKEAEEIARKLVPKDSRITDVNDIVRGRFVVENQKQLDVIKSLAEKEFGKTFKDSWTTPKPTGWRDYTLANVEIAGNKVELQIVSKHLNIANNETHDIYKVIRKLEVTAKNNTGLSVNELDKLNNQIDKLKLEINNKNKLQWTFDAPNFD